VTAPLSLALSFWACTTVLAQIVDFGLFHFRLHSRLVPEKSQFSPEYEIFLRCLRAAREKAGVTQEQLALKLSQTQSTISKMERGERRIDVVELYRICTALGIRSSDFVKKLEQDIERFSLGRGY
jgi:ribosome-binding protein aMBF1 (putative translation factor)